MIPHRARGLRFLLLFPLLLLLAACSRGSSSDQPLAARVEELVAPTTITWSFWGDTWELAVNRRILRAFEREHPEIRVQVEHHPWGEYFTWLRGEWRAGRSPDVIFLNYLPSYVALGELEPVDTYIARDAVPLQDFYPGLLETFKANGRYYGLPRDNDTKVIYYNRAHFVEAGIPEPTAGWTWAELRAAALALTKQDAAAPRYGFGFEPDYWWLVWVWQAAGDVVNDPSRPTEVLLDAPEAVRALQFLQDLIHVDQVTPPAAQLNTDEMNRLFRDGRLSMVFGNHGLVPGFTETPRLAWNVAPLPREAVRVNVAGGAGYTISRRSQNKDAAWELVKFLTGTKAQAILAESGVIVPARRSVREDNIFLRQQPYRADVFLKETELGRPVPNNFPGVTEMERVIGAGLQPLWQGERRAADVIAALMPRVRAAIGLPEQ